MIKKVKVFSMFAISMCVFGFGGEITDILVHFFVRVATAQGKQGIWFLLFPDRENTGNFVLTQGKYLDCDY